MYRARLNQLGLLIFLLVCSECFAAKFRLRLREHFAWTRVNYGPIVNGDTRDYFGLTNTANLWFEERGKFAVGLSFMPVLGSSSFTSSNQGLVGASNKIRLWNIGVEGKYFFFPEKGFFGRAGLTYSRLDTRGFLGSMNGFGYMLGAGWEFEIGQVGIAPELAFRHAFLSQGVSLIRFTPSLAVAFYVF